MDVVRWIDETLRRKWAYYAWRRWWSDSWPAGSPAWLGRIFWFELAKGYENWFVLPAYGQDLEEARTRLESTLRSLGCERLLERSSCADGTAVGFPRCPRCLELMGPDRQLLRRRVQEFRCRQKGCLYRLWLFDPFGHRPPELPNVLGAGHAYDVKAPQPRENHNG